MKTAHPLVLMAAGLALLAGACSTSRKPAPCPPNVACTMMFVSVSTQITDAQGHPAALDEVYTLREGSTEPIRLEQHGEQGYIVVLNDSYQKQLANQSATFHLVGMKNGQKVVNEPFVISADCCHIKKVSGREKIILP